MYNEEIGPRLGRRPGNQGPRTPAAAGLDKSTCQTSLKQTSQTPSSSTSTSSTSSCPQNRKRRLVAINENSEPIFDSWPRFLVIHSLDESKPLSSLSPFALFKGVIGLAGEPKKMTKLASGDFLVEVEKETHSRNLRQAKSIVNIPISVIPHKSLNTCKGIIRCREITTCSEDEILEGLCDQGVNHVKRISVKRDGNLVNTHTYILEFNRPKLPETVKVAWLSIEVAEYIPNPLRCFNCQLYGHHKDRCSRSAVCGNCGESHDENPCPNPPFCINCKQAHPASDRKCPKWLLEREILAVRNRLKISHPEARKIVESRTPTNQSYASITKTIKVNSSTQTDASTNTTFSFEMNSKVSKSNITSQQSLNSSHSSQSFKHKWKKGVNTPKSTIVSPARRNPKAVRDAFVVKNRFGVLADLEGMEIDNSQPSPSPSLRSARGRSVNGGVGTVDNSQQSIPVDSSESAPGTVIDWFDGGQTGVVDADPPQAIQPAPPESHSNSSPLKVSKPSKTKKQNEKFQLQPVSAPK